MPNTSLRSAGLVGILAATFAVAGCGSYRQLQPLDSDEQVDARRVAWSLAHQAPAFPRPADHSEERPVADALFVSYRGAASVARALRAFGIDARRPHGDRIFDVPPQLHPRIEVSFFPGAPHVSFFSAVTLGLIPTVADASSHGVIVFVDSGGDETSVSEWSVLDRDCVLGWLGLPIAVLPQWNAFGTGILGGVPVSNDEAPRVAFEIARAIDEHLRAHAE